MQCEEVFEEFLIHPIESFESVHKKDSFTDLFNKTQFVHYDVS